MRAINAELALSEPDWKDFFKNDAHYFFILSNMTWIIEFHCVILDETKEHNNIT